MLPRLHYVALSRPFVAIEAPYCHKLQHRCNIIAILRPSRCVVLIGRFVAIDTRSCNKGNICGNIQTYSATIMTCGATYIYCCKKCLHIATNNVLVVIGEFLPQFHCVAIIIT
jgi:hypothetical protein